MIHTGNKAKWLAKLVLVSSAVVLAACSGVTPDGDGAASGGADTPYNLGNDVEFSDTTAFSGDHIHWIKIEVPRSTTIQSLSMFAKRFSFGGAAPDNVRMSVYTDDGGYADDLVVGSAVETALTNDLQLLTFDVPPTPITAGTYWVGFNADVDISVRADHSLSAKDVCYLDVAPSSPWPDPLVSPSRSSDSENNLSVYMTVLD